jgi:hypothetical protein
MAVQINMPMSELRKRKIFLTTPMYGGMNAGIFMQSCMALGIAAAKANVDIKTEFLFNESLITRARNYCADHFLRSDSTHLLFIDSDIGFNPHDVFLMAFLMSDDSPYDIMAAPYPKKTIAWEKVIKAVNKGIGEKNPDELNQFVGDFVFNPKVVEGGPYPPGTFPLEAPFEVLEAGTGFMMIRRKTFEKFIEAFPELMYRPDHARTQHFDGSRLIGQYFQAEIDRHPMDKIYKQAIEAALAANDQTQAQEILKTALSIDPVAGGAGFPPKSNRYLSEDYWFCQKAQEIGLKVWMCPWMQTGHMGTMTFGGSLKALAQIGANPTVDEAALKKSA